MADPRPSTDEETAPLLRDPDAEDDEPQKPPTLAERVTAILEEPLTTLAKILLVAALIFLLLTAIFVGLFAGAQHKLNRAKDAPLVTTTATATATSIGTETATATQTQTQITTATTTKTDISTTTALPVPPVPVPTIPPKLPELCFTPDCIILSARLLESLDTTQDPCENFYDFATGGWTKSHPLPADKGLRGQFDTLAVENGQIIRDILESSSAPSTANAPLDFAYDYDAQLLRKLRGLYASCIDEDTLDERGAEPLAKLVKTTRALFRGHSTDIGTQEGRTHSIPKGRKGEGRHVEAALKPGGLTAALSFLHSRGIGGLFEFSVDGDVGVDPNAMSLWFSQPELSLPSKEYYDEESITTLYKDVLARLFESLDDEEDDSDSSDTAPDHRHPRDGSPPNVPPHDGSAYKEEVETKAEIPAALVSNKDSLWPPWPWPPWDGDDGGDNDGKKRNKTEEAKKLAEEVFGFEKRIADASLDLDELYGDPYGTYNPMPLKKLTDALPSIDFGPYLAAFTPRNFPARVIVTYPAYPVSLGRILDSSAPHVIEGYLVARTALTLAPHLGTSSAPWQAVRSLEEELRGIKKGAVGDRSEFCVKKVEEAMGFAAGRYFVNETFGGESREKGTKVITDIVNAFKRSLKKLEWMDDKSANAAAEKADAIRVKVGFPTSPNTLDARSLAWYYNLVDIHEGRFFENMMSAEESDVYKEWQQLGRRRDLGKWEMYPSMVNAYFNPPANEIVFPAGILRPPFFEQNWPAYLAYGSFGHVAAHELTHAFDSSGRLYNQDGKLEEWWTNATSQEFNKRQDCIIEQYSSYWVDDGKGGRVYVNGNLTSGEDIGDTGLVQAFRAWQAQYKFSLASGNEYLLPGLNYSREQLFFISFARIWAQNIKPASAVARVRTDPHSPNRFRVDGTVRNIPAFAEAFNCSAKTKLNPPNEERCLLW